MERIHVVKMHGARNDFIVVDAREKPVSEPASLALRLCDRRGGIGADGLLLVEPSRVADAAMRVFNADGSEAEMCGNGVRCVARYLDERGEGASLTIETKGGIVETRIVEREPTYLVRVAMGIPKYRALEEEGAHFVNLGNLHVVLFRKSVRDLDLVAVATAMQGGSVLPNGGNVHVAVAENASTLRVEHWERGVGATQACGTGAVASAAAAIRAGLATSPVTVHVPGGTLVVEWDGSGVAHMTGPAERVFEADIIASSPS